MPVATLALKVNGRSHSVEVDPATPLLHVLRDELALRGPKPGCGLAQCGSCTVLVAGRAIPSCVTPVGTIAGAEVTTLEGLGTPERPHPIQKAFIDTYNATPQVQAVTVQEGELPFKVPEYQNKKSGK